MSSPSAPTTDDKSGSGISTRGDSMILGLAGWRRQRHDEARRMNWQPQLHPFSPDVFLDGERERRAERHAPAQPDAKNCRCGQ
jgi:hypothetical protein